MPPANFVARTLQDISSRHSVPLPEYPLGVRLYLAGIPPGALTWCWRGELQSLNLCWEITRHVDTSKVSRRAVDFHDQLTELTFRAR